MGDRYHGRGMFIIRRPEFALHFYLLLWVWVCFVGCRLPSPCRLHSAGIHHLIVIHKNEMHTLLFPAPLRFQSAQGLAWSRGRQHMRPEDIRTSSMVTSPRQARATRISNKAIALRRSNGQLSARLKWQRSCESNKFKNFYAVTTAISS